MVLKNKTVYLESGGTKLCEYETDQLEIAPLWVFIFILSLLLNLFALIGNMIVIVACLIQRRKPPLIIYVLVLALSDFCYACLAPFYTYRYILQYWPNLTIDFGIAGRLSHHVTLIGNTFSSISAWLVVALTIDRLILTRFPFKASKWSTANRTVWIIILVIVCCGMFNGVWIYEFFEVPISVNPCNGYWFIPKSVSTVVEGGNGTTTYIPIRYRKPYWIYAIVSAVLFLYALPALILTTCNVVIIRQLNTKRFPRATSQQKNGRSNKKRAEVRLTKMIVVVSIIFLICNIPDIITRLLWKFIDPLIVANIQPIAHLFLMVNVGANFIVYALFNKHLFDTILSALGNRCSCLFPPHSGSVGTTDPGPSSSAGQNPPRSDQPLRP